MKGSLAVTSTPAGARITIDGRATGRTTPATFPDLAIGGTYSVKFDLEGYKSVTRKKTLKVERETLSKPLAARYAGWDGALGRSIMDGSASLADLAAKVEAEDLDPAPISGGQERLEGAVNRRIWGAR